MTHASEPPSCERRAFAARELTAIAAALAAIALLAIADLLIDLRDGATAAHVLTEAAVATAACLAAFSLLRGTLELRRRLHRQDRDFSQLRQQSEAWRAESRHHTAGLSRAIARQLDQWRLSEAEKEVAFLLLKGLSLKDIARVRRTAEKTARVQSSAVYAKSGIGGRSALSAFFLEDLLPPAATPPSIGKD